MGLKNLFIAIMLMTAINFPAVFYKNLELIDLEGKINSRIIVGENADISDALAASSIANSLYQRNIKVSEYLPKLTKYPKIFCNISNLPDFGTCKFFDSAVEIDEEIGSLSSVSMLVGNGDYLDNLTGNMKLDIEMEKILDMEFVEYGFRLNENNFGIFRNNTIKSGKKEWTQKHEAFLTGFVENDSDRFHMLQFLYKTTFESARNNNWGLEKCITDYQSDNYLAYCSITNDPESFIGNRQAYLDILGKSYLILDMAVPFVSNLTYEKDEIIGGKIAIGEGEKTIELKNMDTIETKNGNSTIMIQNGIVRVIPDDSRPYEMVSGEMRQQDNIYIKLWNIENGKAKASILTNVYSIANGGSFKGFTVYLGWGNSLKSISKNEPSRRPDALKSIYLVKTDIQPVELGKPVEIGTDSKIYLQNLGKMHRQHDLEITKIKGEPKIDDEKCNQIEYLSTIRIKFDKETYYYLPEKKKIAAYGEKCKGYTISDDRIYILEKNLGQIYVSLGPGESIITPYGSIPLASFESSRNYIAGNRFMNKTAVYDKNLETINMKIPEATQKNIIIVYSDISLNRVISHSLDLETNSTLNNGYVISAKDFEIDTEPCRINKETYSCNYDAKSFYPGIIDDYYEGYSKLRAFLKNKEFRNIVISDALAENDFPGITIAIGGQYVNRFSENISIKPGDSKIIIDGKNIFIAGYSKEETTEAANSFVSAIQKQNSK